MNVILQKTIQSRPLQKLDALVRFVRILVFFDLPQLQPRRIDWIRQMLSSRSEKFNLNRLGSSSFFVLAHSKVL